MGYSEQVIPLIILNESSILIIDLMIYKIFMYRNLFGCIFEAKLDI